MEEGVTMDHPVYRSDVHEFVALVFFSPFFLYM